MRRMHWSLSLIGWGLAFTLLLSACTAPTQPTDPPLADLPLADLQTSQLAHLHQAAYNYARYHALAPDDLLGLKRLTEVCTALEEAGMDDESCYQAAERVLEGQGDKETRGQGEREILQSPISNLQSPASVLREELEARTDDRRIVAEMLDVPVESVELGPNLVENGGVEEWEDGRPTSWAISDMATGDPWNEGLFIQGGDEYSSWVGTASWVNGLWLQRYNDKEPGRSGYFYSTGKDSILQGKPSVYLLSFYYRTEVLPDRAVNVWFQRNQDGQRLFNHYFPSTSGEWWKIAIIAKNSAGGDVGFYLRSFEPGQVWFDDVQLHSVRLGRGLGLASESWFVIVTGN